jgi:imidazolonepropionase-like amidohydrolase
VLAKLAVSYRQRQGWEWKVKLYQEADEIFQKMRKAGVPMALGTDSGFNKTEEYHDIYFGETERWVQNGATPMETIVAATKEAATVCDASDRLGTIEKGKVADLLVIDGDPLQDIRALRNVKVIIQYGRKVQKRE